MVLWQNQNSHQRELVVRHTETSAEQIQVRVQGLMNARTASLKLLAQRWVERTPPDFRRQRFLQFADAIYTHYPGFTAINWVDPTGVIRWVFPPVGEKSAKERSVYDHGDSRYGEAFQKAGQNHEYAVTPCVDIHQGGVGFDIFRPLVHAGKVQGYLDGVFQVRFIVDTCLSKRIFEDYWIRIYENGRLIYLNGTEGRDRTEEDGLHVLREIRFPGKTWLLELDPKTTVFKGAGPQNLLLLTFGIAVSAILSFFLHLLFRRMDVYKASRDHALHEVRERKRAEDELLERENRLKALLAELADKNAELETFVYTVSHDLKTPIVTIEGFIGAMREDFGDLIPEEGERYLGYISDAALKMESLINDLLEISRIGRLTEKKSNFSFAGIVKVALKGFEPQIRERGIEVKIQENLPRVYGERKRLAQVMENLLSNAIKYIGKENPSPRIDVGVVSIKEQNGQAVFFVGDNGIGIEEIYFEKIFQVFQRLPLAKKAGKGTGIGLAIVKRVIESHGGSIQLTSAPGKGSTFFFTIKTKKA